MAKSPGSLNLNTTQITGFSDETPTSKATLNGSNGQAQTLAGHVPQASIGGSPSQSNVTSPGLDALADVASSFAPLLSAHSNTHINETGLTPSPRHRPAPHGDGTGLDNITSTNNDIGGEAVQKAAPNMSTTTDSKSPQRASPAQSSQAQHIRNGVSHLNPNLITDFPPQVRVKTEASDSPVERGVNSQLQSGIPAHNLPQRVASPGTPLRTVLKSSDLPIPQTSSNMGSRTKASVPKKRPGPKKGTASKPSGKKRKREDGSAAGSPSGARAGTPATSRASQTPVPKMLKGNSATPTRSPSVINGNEEEDEEDDDMDDTEVYCICRKPDDHSVMIACDGPCSDWFHTRCVQMSPEKVELIFKWYCECPIPESNMGALMNKGPICAEKGHETLWKRMCRLEGCNKPARIDEEGRSKYCSHEHGLEFFRRRVYGNGSEAAATDNGMRKRAKGVNGEKVPDDDYQGSKGGLLRPEELKALIERVKDLGSFHKLGDAPDSENIAEVYNGSTDGISYMSEEASILESINAQRSALEERKAMILDRDKFLTMVVARQKGTLALLKEKDKSLKDICGYDARLTWNEYEFNEWRGSAEGQEALKTELLPPPSGQHVPNGATEQFVNNKPDSNETTKHPEEAEIGPGVCKKKRCERHRAWLKGQHQDNALEKENIRNAMWKLEADAKDIKDRAMILSLEGEAV